jgi:CBS domain
MTTVKHVIDQKGHDVHFIHPDASVFDVFDALKLMAENNIGSLVVLQDGKLVGLITERHYAREIVLKGRTSPGTLVREAPSQRIDLARGAAADPCTRGAAMSHASRGPLRITGQCPSSTAKDQSRPHLRISDR